MNQIVQVPRHQLKRRLLTHKRRQIFRQRDIAGLVDLIDLLFRFPFHTDSQVSFDDIAQYYWRFDRDEDWSLCLHGLQQLIYGEALMSIGELERLAAVVTHQTSQINSQLQTAVLGGQVLSITGPNPRMTFFTAVGQRLPAIELL